MKTYPTPWQKKTIWSSLTALALLALGAIAVFVIWLVARVLNFLQPILVPFAVAGVLAYLLDPVVSAITRRRIPRKPAVLLVFCAFTGGVFALSLWVLPVVKDQTVTLATKIPGYFELARNRGVDTITKLRDKYGLKFPEIPGLTAPKLTGTPAPQPSPSPSAAEATPQPSPSTQTSEPTPQPSPSAVPHSGKEEPPDQVISGEWLTTSLPNLVKGGWGIVVKSVGGFLGVFGFLLGMVIIPLYLYYLLTESANISESWSNYLPLRDSRFKDEVVDALTEINGYLIAFFRGQLLVSVINGVHTAILLAIIGIDFWLVIGLMVAVLNIIPYIGIILCWFPAVIVAAVQTSTWLIPAEQWWVLPLVVTGVFILVQQVDGLFITPKIVGESVGLHPMTVILAVLLWSLLLGGLLGAIIAIPLTATLKVLLRRYVWEKRRGTVLRAPLEET